ncbi:imidazolonepropionase [Dethiosulfatibacter aminovorans DSM 17477]|uniref:Imidazolonepropionase n=1 Tax=Dethiosulfatibacter aminovorans DSM 17477 TaxID=1121476 RepID=A0A1M6N2M5_9FIRM|nr:imidazolonepropionase [Dethiosulfatibacter aminovorans]SHJ89906.1 imidazolonepropionase [Dethiosulfatibacter aminovorans DSM 17477]
MNKKKVDLVLSNCSKLLTCRDGSGDIVGVIENGWVAIDDEEIAFIGQKEEVLEKIEYDESNVIDCSGKVVLPGFVDAHTHLVFGGSRSKEYAAGMTKGGKEKFIKAGNKTGINATIDMTRDVDEEILYHAALTRLHQMMNTGTTTVESKSGYGLTVDSEIKLLEINKKLNRDLPVDIVSTFLGAHGWPDNMEKDEYIEVLINEMIPAVAKRNLAEFCDIWCDDGHYTAEESRLVLKCAEKLGMRPKIHTDAYSYIGGSDLGIDMNMVSVDHLNYTPKSVMKKLAESKIPGVLLPATDFAVKHPVPFDAEAMVEAGMTLALGTNCCPGAWNTSMQLVIMLTCREHGVDVETAIKAATLGGAKALNLDSDRGSIEEGKLADIQIWNTGDYEDVIYKLGINQVEKVIKRGRIIVNNA